METIPFYREKKITTSLVFTAFILWLFWLYMLLSGDTSFAFPLTISFASIGIPAWILVLMDMQNRQFVHKKYWVLFMVLFSTFTPIIYVFQRHKLQRIEDTVNA